MKVANLEKLILELSSTMQEVQTKSSEPVIVQPQKNIIEVKITSGLDTEFIFKPSE